MGEDFGHFVADAARSGKLVVQPRMGMSDPRRMRAGLLATKHAAAVAAGTITLDSYTRVGDLASARRSVLRGEPLNGYPLVGHGAGTTREVLRGVADRSFPIQVRHGSPEPEHIFAAMADVGLTATEGGPVSYCLPYSRTPLQRSMDSWSRSCEAFVRRRGTGAEPHLETFGGCMMGQLCPPALLVALSVLEALFFRARGVRSISLSYTQQTNAEQDTEALHALARLAEELLHDLERHIVLYTYMGLYPRTERGALLLLADASRLAARAGAARLIVKTAAEAHRIPTVAENVTALELAAAAADHERAHPRSDRCGPVADTGLYAQARSLVQAVLDLHPDVGQALVRAFRLGVLDVPFCLHPDNPGRSRSYLDTAGRIQWTDIGRMPLRDTADLAASEPMTSSALLDSLSFVQRTYDGRASASARRRQGARMERDGSVPRLFTSPQIQAARRSRSRGLQPSQDGTMSLAASGIMPQDPQGLPAFQDPPLPPADTRDHLTSPVTRAALRVQQRLLAATREHLTGNGFAETMLPVMGPVTDPGSRGAKQVDVDFYGHKYKLMTSAILYKQASLLTFDKIFCIAPNVRLEPQETAHTSRHLAEFHQIDVEVAGADREQVMALLEQLMRHVVGSVVRECPEELAVLGRAPDAFRPLLQGNFVHRAHADAVAELHAKGHPQNPDAEIDWPGEVIISRAARAPFFLTDYPKGSRGFYDRESAETPGVLRNFDLIAPEGYGELCSGSEREFDYARIVTRMRETSENPAKYDWYLRLAREGIPASAGFGIGVERLTRYVTGLDAAWQTSLFPKLPGRVSP
ncbi:amino acid--tRNA ligase-related protein [Streptomyces koyangensis]|uniref:Aminoacyl-transfer RNA synthetases class-II family profile domain-containing protein n=1 Tax=Streptomyces koyangensis TaxID=188770 RepID=A0A385D619_9ACTN|nr:amino acid--tRNA ligase-related protein [Streptomyces koyangensis]AXQ53529.1 hypothetical protein D0C37_02115 [Streptomyces koyangensis]